MEQTRRLARRAGVLYFIACITAPFALIYVPATLVVPGEAAATAEHLRSSEALLRLGIAGELFNAIVVIFAVLAFYRLFESVSRPHALAMAALFLVSVPISLLNVLNDVAALFFAQRGVVLSAVDPRQSDALAYMFMRLHGQGLAIASIFWGLWLFPFGLLVMRSGFIPRVLGFFLLLAGVGNVLNAVPSLLLPRYAALVRPIALALSFGEVPLLIWLLVWGAKEQPAGRISSLPAGR